MVGGTRRIRQRPVFIINFDEWGGFFDHVPPTEAPDVDPRFQLRGFRVPAIVISPFARRGTVSVRDTNANNLADALDFTSPSLAAPDLTAPELVTGLPCGL